MAIYSESPSEMLETIARLRGYLSLLHGKERVPIALLNELDSTLRNLRDYYFEEKGDRETAEFLHSLTRRITKVTSADEVRDILRKIEHKMVSLPFPRRAYAEERLEGKITALEHELARLRSNPALEKKVAKLEKELQKIRVASIVSFEGNEREQKDMLKNYKEAEKRVFVIMPFAPIYDDVWKGGIERACNSEDFGYLRVDKISLSSWITEDIVDYMEMADFVITDISGSNPNVMFELGWALAKDKKPIVIRQQDDPNQVPFDVKDIRYISYINSWSGIERLYRDICKFLKTTSETVKEEAPKKKTRRKKSAKAKEN